ncbi:MAG: hypothetical protein HZB39_14200 [Planctomycetes bacterium]|nr:hypothetical protein [Planctomycetota bacterium]
MFHPLTTLLPGVLTTVLVTGVPSAPKVLAPLPVEHVFEAGDHEIAALIDQVATALGRNYLYNPAEITAGGATIKLQSRLVVQESELEPTLARLLFTKALYIVPLAPEQGIAEVISRNGPRRMEIDSRAAFVTPEEVFAHPDRVDVVTTVFALQHISAAQFSVQMRPLLAGNSPNEVTTGAVDERTLLVRGTRSAVAAVLELARRADEAMARAADRAEVEALRKRVQELESPRGTPSGR